MGQPSDSFHPGSKDVFALRPVPASSGRRRVTLFTRGILALLVIGIGWVAWRDIQQQQLNRALILAIKAADAQNVRGLLDRGADPDTFDVPQREISLWGFLRDRLRGLNGAHAETPALALAVTSVASPYEDRAAYARGVTIVKALLDHGARIDIRDAQGTDIINLAVESDHDSQILRLLIQRWTIFARRSSKDRASLLNLKNPVNGRTALISAAVWGKPEQLDLLIGGGANVDLQDEQGQTVLMLAVERSRTENIACLLAHHANLRLKDRNGNTALSLARINRDTDVTTPFNHEREADFWPHIVRMLEQAR